MAENDNRPKDEQQQESANTDDRYTKNLSPAARKRVMARAKAIDQLLEGEDEEDGE